MPITSGEQILVVSNQKAHSNFPGTQRHPEFHAAFMMTMLQVLIANHEEEVSHRQASYAMNEVLQSKGVRNAVAAGLTNENMLFLDPPVDFVIVSTGQKHGRNSSCLGL